MRTDVEVSNPDAGSTPEPRRLLADHHRAIDIVCRDLLDRTYADDPLRMIEQYRTFERAILEHLVAEEELVVPAYARAAPFEARAILDDHAELRQRLFQVAIEAELHYVRAETVCELIEQLRAHAAREDASMYAWAQDHLPPSVKRQLFKRVRRSLRLLARRGRPHHPEAVL